MDTLIALPLYAVKFHLSAAIYALIISVEPAL
jgi:hypothetical protein